MKVVSVAHLPALISGPPPLWVTSPRSSSAGMTAMPMRSKSSSAPSTTNSVRWPAACSAASARITRCNPPSSYTKRSCGWPDSTICRSRDAALLRRRRRVDATHPGRSRAAAKRQQARWPGPAQGGPRGRVHLPVDLRLDFDASTKRSPSWRLPHRRRQKWWSSATSAGCRLWRRRTSWRSHRPR